ncbi:unnamed protein product [Absidia cylindrospora]
MERCQGGETTSCLSSGSIPPFGNESSTILSPPGRKAACKQPQQTQQQKQSQKQKQSRKQQQQQQQRLELERQQQERSLYQHKDESFNTHHLLSSGSILNDIYKWTAHVEHLEQRRQRTQSISLPATRTPVTDPLLQSLKQPGGFRRHFVLTKAVRQGKRPPNFVTSSFVEFLCLYGHFGGEDLSDTDDDSSTSDDDDDDDDGSSDEFSSSSESENYTGTRGNHSDKGKHHHHHHYRPLHEQEEGNVMAYGGPLLHQASLSSVTRKNNQQKHYGTAAAAPVTPETDTGRSKSTTPLTAAASSAQQQQNPMTSSSSSTLPFPVSAKANGDHHQPLQYRHLHARETMPLLSRSRPGQTLQGKATPGKAMFLLLKSFVTTGIMFLPKA